MLGVTWGESYCVMGHVGRDLVCYGSGGERLSVLWVGWDES